MERGLAHTISVIEKRPTVVDPGYRWPLFLRPENGGAANESRTPPERLEVEAGLHLNDSGTQRVLGLAEMSVQDVILNIGQIQLVEEVVEVGANLQLCVFAQKPQLRQAERFGESRVHIEVPGAGE